MLSSFAGWFSSLSTMGKVGIVTAGLMGTGVTATAISDPPSEPFQNTSVTEALQEPTCEAKETRTTKDETIKFKTDRVEDPNLEEGKEQVITDGEDGVRKITYKKTVYTPLGCKKNKSVVLSSTIAKKPVNKIVSVGTYVVPEPDPPSLTPASNCDPNYSGCVPNVSYDLDCVDIGYSVTVYGADPHRFDADHDGIGCESY